MVEALDVSSRQIEPLLNPSYGPHSDRRGTWHTGNQLPTNETVSGSRTLTAHKTPFRSPGRVRIDHLCISMRLFDIFDRDQGPLALGHLPNTSSEPP
jgi:hypothetical protein